MAPSTRAWGVAAIAALGLAACTSKDEGHTGSNPAITLGGSSGMSSGGASGAATGAGKGGASAAGAGAGNAQGGSGNASQAGSGNAGSAGAPRGGGGGDGNQGGTDAGSSGRAGSAGGAGRASGGAGTSAGSGGTDVSGAAGDTGTGACSPNDEFEGTELDSCWLTLNGSTAMPLIAIAQKEGALHLSANGNQGGVWYQGATKSLIYQLVSAQRFTLTTTAHPRKFTDPESLPTKDLHVGGLMVRNPSSAGGSTENYVFIMVGHSENNNGMVHQGVEFKTTVNGCSDWAEPDWGASHDEPDAELRICRLGAEFRMYKRVPGDATWTAAPPPSGCNGNDVTDGVLSRSDMPESVQVGLALNFNAPSDLEVAFDSIHFVELPEGATADTCTN